MDMEKFAEELKQKSGVDGEKAWNLVESWYTRDGRARRLSLHDLHELSQVIAKGLKHIRAEARAEALREVYEEIRQAGETSVEVGDNPRFINGLYKALQLVPSAAILANEPKEREENETGIDFVEPTSRDMQIADEVRMCKLGVGAAMRVAKYRIEVERKLKEAER